MKNLSVLIKPASSDCNMKCRYCFYGDTAAHRNVPSHGIMKDSVTTTLLEQIVKDMPSGGSVSFTFQGGEPCMAGLSYFENFILNVGRIFPQTITADYSLQTNGTLIDQQWCDFLKAHKFLVGISLDGIKSIHDRLRIDHVDGKTFSRVMDSVSLLKKNEIDINILTVITKEIVEQTEEVYQFYKKCGFTYVQFIPCLEPIEEGINTPYGLTSHDYGSFLKKVFWLWYEDIKRGRYISIRYFDNIVWMLRGRYPEMCGLLGKCHVQYVVESDGSIYPCDFYALDKYNCGNITETSLQDIRDCRNMKHFMSRTVKRHPLCEQCKVSVLCHGGCSRYRNLYEQDSVYCPIQDFLYETYERFAEIAAMV